MTALALRNLFHDRVRLPVTLTGVVFAVVLRGIVVVAQTCGVPDKKQDYRRLNRPSRLPTYAFPPPFSCVCSQAFAIFNSRWTVATEVPIASAVSS